MGLCTEIKECSLDEKKLVSMKTKANNMWRQRWFHNKFLAFWNKYTFKDFVEIHTNVTYELLNYICML